MLFWLRAEKTENNFIAVEILLGSRPISIDFAVNTHTHTKRKYKNNFESHI